MVTSVFLFNRLVFDIPWDVILLQQLVRLFVIATELTKLLVDGVLSPLLYDTFETFSKVRRRVYPRSKPPSRRATRLREHHDLFEIFSRIQQRREANIAKSQRFWKAPWRYRSALPAVWVVLSSVMLPKTTVAQMPFLSARRAARSAKPIKLYHTATQRLTRAERFHRFLFRSHIDGTAIQIVENDGWGEIIEDHTIPASELHMSGYGWAYQRHLDQQYARAHALSAKQLQCDEDFAQNATLEGEPCPHEFDPLDFSFDPTDISSTPHESTDTAAFPEVPQDADEPSPHKFAPMDFLTLRRTRLDASFPIDLSQYITMSPRFYHTETPDSSVRPFDPDYVTVLTSELTDDDPDRELFTVILDTGASFAITFDEQDFVGDIIRGEFGTIKTVSDSLQITGVGKVSWTFISDDGTQRQVFVPCHLVPGASQRLLSPQDFCRYHFFSATEDQFGGNTNYMWMNVTSDRARIRCPMHPITNLPVALAKHTKPTSCTCGSCGGCLAAQAHSSIGILDETNQNLTAAQKELLLDHQRLGHLSMEHLQCLYKPTDVQCEFDGCEKEGEPCLQPTHAGVLTCDIPQCLACNAAKAKRRSTGSTHTKKRAERQDIMSAGQLQPGAKVSVDHYESAVRGRLTSTRGRESSNKKYVGGTLFFDHASGLISVHHQVSLSAVDTLRSKRKFEQDASRCGVHIDTYHTDNGVFKSNAWQQQLQADLQDYDFSGVGAHHQNGNAERAIQTVVYRARALMLHAQFHWPDEFDQDLWPFALSYSAWLYNHTPGKTNGLAPMELFCGTKMSCEYLRRARVWGCPTYILDPRLQDGKKIPKWEPRSRRGQFLGFSPDHSTNIGLQRNLNTGAISPQFHVVYDEKFQTVASEQSVDLQETFTHLFKTNRVNELEDTPVEDRPEIHDDWLTADEITARNEARNAKRKQRTAAPAESDDEGYETDGNDSHFDYDINGEANEEAPLGDDNINDPNTDPNEEPAENNPNDQVKPEPEAPVGADQDATLDQGEPEQPNPEPDPLGRGHRKKERNQFLRDDIWILQSGFNSLKQNSKALMSRFAYRMSERTRRPLSRDVSFLMSIDWGQTSSDPIAQRYEQILLAVSDPFTREIYLEVPLALAARANAADTPTLREILNYEDPDEVEAWFESMGDEMNELYEKDTFDEVDRSEAILAGKQVIPSTWAFRRKRNPDLTLKRRKSRFCIRGDLMKSDDLTKDSTYAPVIDWGTLRMLFAMSVQHKLYTTQIDFKNAFVQADLPEPIYVEYPELFRKGNEGKVLKVKKSLYGDRRAPRLWYDHVRTTLVSPKYGFTVSTIDHCLFLKDGMAIALYVDDAIIMCNDKKDADDFLHQLTADNFDFTREASLARYLGIEIESRTDGSLCLKQPGLTDRVIQALGLEDASTKSTPATGPLGRCLDSASYDNAEFNYRSVVGMLMYLSGNARLDIAYAVHQCARFSADPRMPHAVALKRIGRYLKGTRDQGFIIKPDKRCNLDCYVDADFAGLWNYEDLQDPSVARSRTGYFITLGNTPVVWSSKLQTEIALSTMESEYIALSTALRALLPMRELQASISKSLKLPYSSKSNVSSVFEDNQAALTLATTNPPRMTPRSRHICVKYHWFRSHLSKDTIVVVPIDTEHQKANILTKADKTQKFRADRLLTMGW